MQEPTEIARTINCGRGVVYKVASDVASSIDRVLEGRRSTPTYRLTSRL